MSLITISGYPSSGKTTRVRELQDCLSKSGFSVSVVADTGPEAYNDPASEKQARAILFTAVQRQLSASAVVIVDAPNYIKGFRYQLYCAARELKLRVCTIHVVATQDLCREWNVARPVGYSDETLENLFQRYEEPSSMVRWDSPLFTVSWLDPLPTAQILDAITSGSIKPPNSGTLNPVKPPTDALLTIESVSLAIISAIFSAQPLPYNLTISLPPRSISFPELQRHKRQFVSIHKKAITLGTTERGPLDWSEQSVAQMFILYLNQNL